MKDSKYFVKLLKSVKKKFSNMEAVKKNKTKIINKIEINPLDGLYKRFLIRLSI